MARIEISGLAVDPTLYRFVNEEAIPGSGLKADAFWAGFAAIIARLAPRNAALLAERDRIQAALDDYHRARRGQPIVQAEYQAFLREIGYLVPEPAPFEVTTANVDAEFAHIAGPQLVVPVTNARYALNAANARWGSLYDALYGTDALPETDGATRGPGYNPVRGAAVVAYARGVLDEIAPLATGSHADATGYRVAAGGLAVTLKDGTTTHPADPAAFAGYQGEPDAPGAILLRHHGLHAEIVIDRAHPIGATDPAGVADVIMEAAVSTIQDCEDSVACVDAADKVEAYRN